MFISVNKMLNWPHLVSGRSGVAVWRHRKRAALLICFMAALCLICFRWPSISFRIVDRVPPLRSLNSLGQEGENSPEKRPLNNPVQFVSNESGVMEDAAVVLQDISLINKRISGSESMSDRFDVAKMKLQKINDEKRRNLNEKEVKMNSEIFSFPKEVLEENGLVNNAAAAWSGGAFKYNPYGEPVYEHGNRPNYIPKERVIHFDLKGAPPLPSVYKTLIPWLGKYGATAILIEYEDMFPWKGPLASVAANNHYSEEEIKAILQECASNNIKVIPLVQTFGHLEFVLKGEKFSHLREIPRIPQALCPSQNDSMWLVKNLVDQIMALHPNVQYLHIGCDEVFQMGECDRCRLKTRETLFLDHVSATAKYVRSAYNVIPIIWHDMLTHVSDSAMKDYNFGELVEPMVWVYAEDIYRFAQPSMWSKLSEVFPYVWAASAFKGAFGEQSTVPNVRRHLDNNLNWLDVMSTENSKFLGGFRGLVITGWQRFDHFAVLCELLPASMPSLAVNLIAASHGFFNSSVLNKLYESMTCMQVPKYQTGLNLDSDPYLWDKFSWCFFPGALVFKATARLDVAKKEVMSYIERVTGSRGWITDYNRRHNFSSPMRIDEDLIELPSRLHTVTLLLKTVKEALSEWYDDWTVGEWIELHIWTLMNKLQTLQKESRDMKYVKTWPVRPLSLLKDLEPFGVAAALKKKE